MQRLLSSFADGWPGTGLLLLRLLTCTALNYFGIVSLQEASPLAIVVPQIIGIGAGILLLIGLWTPVAGVLAAIVNVWIAFSRYFSHSGDPWTPIALAGSTSIFQNARQVSYPPKVLASDLTTLLPRPPTI